VLGKSNLLSRNHLIQHERLS